MGEADHVAQKKRLVQSRFADFSLCPFILSGSHRLHVRLAGRFGVRRRIWESLTFEPLSARDIREVAKGSHGVGNSADLAEWIRGPCGGRVCTISDAISEVRHVSGERRMLREDRSGRPRWRADMDGRIAETHLYWRHRPLCRK